MAARVWNTTQKKWITYPGEVNPGDIIQRNEKNTTPMHWVKEAMNRDGSRRYSGHWAQNATIEKVLNGPGKGGKMTDIHREGELELYCKFYSGPIHLVPPVVIPCAAASICKDFNTQKCKIDSDGTKNLREIFPDNAIYDPRRNLSNNYSCDVVIPNITNSEAFGMEVHNTNSVSIPKWLSGMPMLEFDCQSAEQLKAIKQITTFIDLTQPNFLRICHPYNLGMLPCYRNRYPCETTKILTIMAEEANKYERTIKKTKNKKTTKDESAPFTGYEPWDIWVWDYPRGVKGQLIEKVIRDKRSDVEWTRSEADYYRPLIKLSRRTRDRFNLKPTNEEIAMDALYLQYLKEKKVKKALNI